MTEFSELYLGPKTAPKLTPDRARFGLKASLDKWRSRASQDPGTEKGLKATLSTEARLATEAISRKFDIESDDLSDCQIELLNSLDFSSKLLDSSADDNDKLYLDQRFLEINASAIHAGTMEDPEYFSRNFSDKKSADLYIALIGLSLPKPTEKFSVKQLGNRLDLLLTKLSIQSIYLQTSEDSIVKFALVIKENLDKNYPGLEADIREELFLRSLQLIAGKTLGLPSPAGPRDKQIPYPTKELNIMIDVIRNKPSLEKIFTGVLALTSPYKCSLGKSSVGVQNLSALRESAKQAKSLSELIPEHSPLRFLAEYAVVQQMYHIEGKDLDDAIITSFLPCVQTKFRKYQTYRSSRPLWQDRLNIFGKFQGEIPEESSEDEDIRIGVTTKILQALAALDSGEYLSLHEAFTGNGATDLSYRSSKENNLLLLASGTPDDPYIKYGSYNIGGKKYLNASYRYGLYTFILKEKVIQRSSIIFGDSFSSHTLPFVGLPAVRKTLRDFVTERHYAPYVEAQIHGGFSMEDVDYILVVDQNPDKKLLATLSEKSKKWGIEVRCQADLPD